MGGFRRAEGSLVAVAHSVPRHTLSSLASRSSSMSMNSSIVMSDIETPGRRSDAGAVRRARGSWSA